MPIFKPIFSHKPIFLFSKTSYYQFYVVAILIWADSKGLTSCRCTFSDNSESVSFHCFQWGLLKVGSKLEGACLLCQQHCFIIQTIAHCVESCSSEGFQLFCGAEVQAEVLMHKGSHKYVQPLQLVLIKVEGGKSIPVSI